MLDRNFLCLASTPSTMKMGNLGTGSPINSDTSVTGGFTSGGTTSPPGFLSNPFDAMADYGRTEFDIHNRGLLGGSIAGPYGFRLNPFLIVNSGPPYNFTIGQNVNGFDTFNQRLAVVSSASCLSRTIQATSVVCTPLGTFNNAPPIGQSVVPLNYGRGPAQFT